MSAAMIAASVAAPIIGGIVGNIMGAGDRKKARNAMKQAYAELEAIGFPPDLSKEVILKEFERAGIYSPELEEDLSSTFEEVQTIKEDPSLRQAQLKALQSMQQRAKVGLSAEDRAALNEVRRASSRDAEAKRQQILQNMAARGMGGSGAELIAQLQSSQAAAEQASMGSDTLMAQAQQRALQALGQSSDIASGIRSQDFGVNSANTAAMNERNRFLAENSIARQRQNVNMLNEAQRLNLAEQQRIQDANIAMQNQEKLRQNQAQRDVFQDKLGLASAKAGALTGQANYYQGQAQNTAQSMAGVGSAVGGGLSAYNQQQQNQNNMYAAASGLTKDPVTGQWVKK